MLIIFHTHALLPRKSLQNTLFYIGFQLS
jgi:hypothetical protein